MQEPAGPEFERLTWGKNKQHGWKAPTREEEVGKHEKKVPSWCGSDRDVSISFH